MPSPASFDFVVSAENNYYIAWQAMLFHFSCLTQMNRPPIIVVHGNDDEALLPQFELIQRHGGRVQRARNFRDEGGWEYPPRNTSGTLRVVESEADYLVICDPDMIFLRPLPLRDFALAANQISFDRVSYLIVTDENRPALEQPSRAAGVDLQPLSDHRLSGGVPHIIPRSLQADLSRDWLDCIALFEPRDTGLRNQPGIHLDWLSTMWAIIFAANRLDLDVVMTDWSITNCPGTGRLDTPENQQASIIHYCFGDEEFDKRNYMDESGAAQRVWQCSGSPHSINAAIIGQLQAAADFFAS